MGGRGVGETGRLHIDEKFWRTVRHRPRPAETSAFVCAPALSHSDKTLISAFVISPT